MRLGLNVILNVILLGRSRELMKQQYYGDRSKGTCESRPRGLCSSDGTAAVSAGFNTIEGFVNAEVFYISDLVPYVNAEPGALQLPCFFLLDHTATGR